MIVRVKRRQRAASLSDSEIMTIKSYFQKAVSYNRFVELESRVFFLLMFFLNLGAFGRCTGITFVDSTMISVCHNLRRYVNKVFKRIATDGKGTMGWCHGFKLHLACNDRGEIMAQQKKGGDYFIFLVSSHSYRWPLIAVTACKVTIKNNMLQFLTSHECVKMTEYCGIVLVAGFYRCQS